MTRFTICLRCFWAMYNRAPEIAIGRGYCDCCGSVDGLVQ
jgi:hypothetical protein